MIEISATGSCSHWRTVSSSFKHLIDTLEDDAVLGADFSEERQPASCLFLSMKLVVGFRLDIVLIEELDDEYKVDLSPRFGIVVIRV